MKATLTFDLPEEQTEHQNAVDGGRAFSVLHDILYEVRLCSKYDADPKERIIVIGEIIRGEFPDIDER